MKTTKAHLVIKAKRPVDVIGFYRMIKDNRDVIEVDDINIDEKTREIGFVAVFNCDVPDMLLSVNDMYNTKKILEMQIISSVCFNEPKLEEKTEDKVEEIFSR